MIPLFMNSRTKSYDLLVFEALLRRLQEKYWYNEKIISGYKRNKAGYDGERNVDYALSTYQKDDFYIIRGIRLENPPFHFQIDTLILSKKFIGILEIKNYKDKLRYDSKQRQLTQEVNGKIKAFKDPILQAEAQKRHLKMWLQQHGPYDIPIETLVVIAFPSTIIENVHQDPESYEKFIHTASLHHRLDIIVKKYTREILTTTSLNKIGHTILKADKPLRTDILSQLNINEQHLIKGIACRKCNYYPMEQSYKKWYCPECKCSEIRTYERDIFDYFLLYGDTITNKECRDYLRIKSPVTSHKILKSMNLKQTGNNSARKYHAPSPSSFPQRSYIPAKLQSYMKQHND